MDYSEFDRIMLDLAMGMNLPPWTTEEWDRNLTFFEQASPIVRAKAFCKMKDRLYQLHCDAEDERKRSLEAKTVEAAKGAQQGTAEMVVEDQPRADSETIATASA